MSKITQKRLPQEVSTRVLTQIADGEYLPGSYLPSENEMAENFGVSRIVIREATRLLSSKGVIEVQQGRGTFVTPQDNWNQMDPQILLALLKAGRLGDLAQDLVEMRKMLEVEAAGLAALRADGENIEALKTLLEQMQASQPNVQQYITLEHEYHTAIWHAAHNKLLLHLLESLSEVFLTVKGLVYRSNWTDVDRDHEGVLNAIRQHDSPGARQAMENDISRFEAEIRQAMEQGLQ